MPMITLTGACATLARLPSLMHSTSLALACALRTKTKRAGLQLAEVGPHLSSSYNWCSRLSGTGWSR